MTFLESEETVPESDVEEDKLNFRDNLKFAIQHSNRTRKNVIEKHLAGIKHWGMSLIEQQDGAAQALKNRPVVLRNRRQKKKTSDVIVNLPYFFYSFAKDHSLPNLIWNHKVNRGCTVSSYLIFICFVFPRLVRSCVCVWRTN